jgi:peptidylprolyl isomerase
MKSSKDILRSSFVAGSALLGASRIAIADDAKASPVPDKDGFVTTESGLKYRDTKIGTGAVPLPGDTVRVHYTGWLDDFESEKKFDSSYDRRSPLTFKAGVKQVIAGWDEALLTDLKVGGKRDLIIPPELGYGKRGAGGVIPPNATLYFKIELVGIGAR